MKKIEDVRFMIYAHIYCEERSDEMIWRTLTSLEYVKSAKVPKKRKFTFFFPNYDISVPIGSSAFDS